VNCAVIGFKNTKYSFALLGLMFATPLLAGPPKPVVEDKIKDKFMPAAFDAQTIEGLLGDRMRVNVNGRLLHVDEQGIMAGFSHRPGVQPWIGEHAGKFLHAAANSWQYTRDRQLKLLMDRIAKELIEAQLPDGYLGTYTDDQRWTSWDVWVHKYDLIGLLSYYQATGYQPALDASKKIGDLLVSTFGDKPGQRDIIKSGTHVGMAATSVLEPICMLYRYTGDLRYLEFAGYVVRSSDQPNGPKIIQSLLDSGSVYKTANAKAYEMLSNIVGLTDLYRLTGDEKFFKVAQIAWNDVAQHRLYISGTASSHEHFQEDGHFPAFENAEVGEGCVTVTWLQLNWQLLRLTGDVKYADELERTVFNQLLAAQDPNSGNICYFTPLIGRKNATRGINCCVSSEPRGISMIPQLVWGEKDGGIAVLLYSPGALHVNGIDFIEQTNFPETGKVTFFVHPAKKLKFPIYLRVPYWTTKYTATINGESVSGTPGEFVKLERTWKPGDKIDVEMDMTVKTISGGSDYPGSIAIQRGPQILALDEAANPSIEFLHAAAPRSDKLTAQLSQKYLVDGVAVSRDGKKSDKPLTLMPFADAARYRVWLTKPEALPSEPVNVAAFGKESVSRQGSDRGSICDERRDTFRSTANAKPAAEDWYAVEFNRPEQIKRIVYRHGEATPKGGWFEGKPEIQIKRTVQGNWETIAQLDSYNGSATLPDGQPFEATLAAPVKAYGIRIIGKPAAYSSCAELAAYAQ
jgi:DUF1680 family protein